MHLCAHMLPPSRSGMCCQSLSDVVFFLPLSCDWRDVKRKERQMRHNANWSPKVHLQKFNALFWKANAFAAHEIVIVQKLSKRGNFSICDSGSSHRLVLK